MDGRKVIVTRDSELIREVKGLLRHSTQICSPGSFSCDIGSIV